MNIEEKKKEILKQAESFYEGLGDMDDEAGFIDGVKYALDKVEQLIKDAETKARKDENKRWVKLCNGDLSNAIQIPSFLRRYKELEGDKK